MKIKRIVSVILALALASAVFAGCAVSTEPTAVAALKGPTGMGMVKLMNDETDTGKYEFTLASAPDEIVGKLTSGEVDIAALPTNLAASLYQKTNGGVQIVAVNTLGVLYVITTDGSVAQLSDLAGRKLLASGQGSTPEYVLNYILEANGLTDKVEVEYMAEHAEVVTQLAAGNATAALLPEPFVTVAAGKAGTTVALNITDEFAKAIQQNGGADAQLAMGCLVANSEFVKNNKGALDKFLSDYKTSTEWVNANVDDAAALIESYEIVASAAMAKAALPNCNIVYIDGADMKDTLAGFYQVLFDSNPAFIGGSLPDDGFYYMG